MTCGTPINTYYLGDSLGSPWYVNFEIGQTSWNYAQVGYGTAANGTGYDWGVANWYEDGEGSNKRVRRDIGGLQFTSTGNWYLICQANESGPDTYTSGSACGWLNSTVYPPASMAYFTVSPLEPPSSVSATNSDGKVELGWTRSNDKDVMILMTLDDGLPTGSPEQGKKYLGYEFIGNQIVVPGVDGYGLQSGTNLDVTAMLWPGQQTYHFTFYSVNNSNYYSEGVTAPAVNSYTPAARNTGGGAVEQPAEIFLGDQNLTFGCDTWGTLDGNWGRARMWTQRYSPFNAYEKVFGDWGDFTNAAHKTCTPAAGVFFLPGLYTWGIQVDYGEPYGDNFCYVDDTVGGWLYMLDGSWSSLYLEVRTLNEPTNQTAARSAAAPQNEIDLSWEKDPQGHNVMVVRKLATDSWSEPAPGTAYAVGTGLGSGTVVYNGSGTAFTNTGLSASTTYDYKFYSDNNSYYSAGVTASTNTDKQDQTIDFPAISDKVASDMVGLAATASSGLPVSFAVDTGPGVITDGTNLAFTGTGTVSIVASQTGNETYNPAPEVTRSFNVALPPVELVLTQTNVNVREAGEGRFFVHLNRDPEGTRVVNVSRSAGDTSVTIKSGASRSFNSANWNTWQAVTLAQAADDGNAASETATFRVSLAGADDQSVSAFSLDDDIGTNLALASGGATITGTKASRPAQLIDGIHTVSTNYGYTIWTNVPAGSMTVDLKERYELSRVRVLNWDWVARVHRYQIEYSENGSSWTTLVDASGEDHSGWDEWILSDEMARYLRFTGLSNSANQCVVLAELEVYGVSAPPPLVDATLSESAVNVRENGQGRFFIRLPSAPTGNVVFTVSRVSGSTDITVQGGSTRAFTAANWSSWQAVTLAAAADGNPDGETATFQISAAGYNTAYVTATALDDDIAENVAMASGGATIIYWKGGQVAKLIDGIQTDSANYGWTYWNNVPQGTITLDMKAQMTVSRIRLLGWDWVYRLQGYQIEASTDGVGWSTIITAASGRHGWDEWTLADETIRYLRFTGLTNTANSTVCITELEVYGTRPAGRRALAKGAVVASAPVSVLTSEGVADESGWNAVDGDAGTAWVGSQAGGGYILVEYAPTLTLNALEVDLAEGSLADVDYLYSQDGEDWQPLPEDLEANPVSLNFLWLAFPGDGTAAVPNVIEIRPNP